LPDKNRTDTSLEEQVVLLQKALTRERNAKRKLEEKLEEKLQNNFEENHEFFQAYENANSRQIQLQFLSSLTSDIFVITDLDQMMAKFLANISKFLEPCNAFIFINNKNDYSLKKLNISNKQFDYLDVSHKLPELYNSLQKLDTQNFWQRIDIKSHKELHILSSTTHHDTILVYPLRLTNNKMHFLILDINHYCYSDDFKQTLNTASKQFAMTVKRRLTEIELSYNYQKLESTLEQLKSTQHQLVHSEKMASLGQLSAGVAHEINNPLGYITSNFEILKEYCELFESAFLDIEKASPDSLNRINTLSYARNDITDLLSSCIKGVGRISDIVNSLKTFSRKDDDDFINTNINDVIENALKIVWNQLKYNHKVETTLAPNLDLILASEGQLQQVFVNLFINAAQAMKEQGVLSIETKQSGGYIEVSVSDTGCGMKETTLKNIFEPFYTTKQNQNGTGLGLSVSYAIIEKHQALISVNSEPNVGSTFVIRFPPVKTL
jgi:signal transduction histidine kinase